MNIDDMDISWEHTTVLEAISQTISGMYNSNSSSLVLIEDVVDNEDNVVTYTAEGHLVDSNLKRTKDMFEFAYRLKREGDIVHIECDMNFDNTPEMISVLDQMSDQFHVSQLTSMDRYKTSCQSLSIDTSEPKVIIEKFCELFVIETLQLLRANPTENKFKVDQLVRGDIIPVNGQLRIVESLQFGYDNHIEVYLYPEIRQSTTITMGDDIVVMF